MSRHPYTYAADFVRSLPALADNGISAKLSRSDAAKIIQGIADVIGMSKETLSIKLSEYFQQHEDRISSEAIDLVVQNMQRQDEEPK